MLSVSAVTGMRGHRQTFAQSTESILLQNDGFINLHPMRPKIYLDIDFHFHIAIVLRKQRPSFMDGFMTPSQISSALHTLLSAHQAVFLWGAPGVGKSQVVAKVAADRGMDLTYERFCSILSIFVDFPALKTDVRNGARPPFSRARMIQNKALSSLMN